MSNVLTIDGKPAGPVVTDVKKAHDPKELRMHQARMTALFMEILNEFKAAFQQREGEPPSPVQPDWDAVKKVACDRWESAVDTFNSSSVAAKPADRDLMAKTIDGMRRNMEENQVKEQRLCDITDLTPHGFLFCGIAQEGDLWLSQHCAVATTPNGGCRVWLRGPEMTDENWFGGWLPSPTNIDLSLSAPDYTLGSLQSLLAHLGVGRIIPPTELQMAAARQRRMEDGQVVGAELRTDRFEPHPAVAIATIVVVACLVLITVKLWIA